MIRKSDEPYYKIPGLMFGCAVDAQVKDGLTALADGYRNKLLEFLRKNKEHVHTAYKDQCYPHGVFTDYYYSVPQSESWLDTYMDQMGKDLSVIDCGLVIETDEPYSRDRESRLRGLAQKVLEEKQR